LLGEALTRMGKAAEGERFLRRAVELREQLDDSDSFWLAEARISLSNALIAARRFTEANQLLNLAAAAEAHQPALSDEYRAPLRAAQNLIAQAHN
jgi:MoxR-like ATPase